MAAAAQRNASPSVASRAPPLSMKTLLLAAGLSVVTGTALADLPVGRGVVSATVAATATYDSNVFGTRDATSDYYGTLAPRVTYVRQAGAIEAEAHAGIALIRYLEQTQLNADNVSVDAALKVAAADFRNYTGLLSAAYVESSGVNTDINARVNARTTTYIGHGALETGPRSDVALSGTYTDVQNSVASDQQTLTTEAMYDYKDFLLGNSLRVLGDYDRLRTSGGNTLGVPLNQESYMMSAGLGRGLFKDTVRAGLSYGYRILERSAVETSTGRQREEGSVISATLEGPFLPEKYFPKVKSSFALIYQNAATPGINDNGSTKELTGKLSLAWQARTNTTATFTAQRSQRLSVNDLSVVTTSVQVGLDQVLRYNLTGSLLAGYDWSTYRTVNRQDETGTLGARLRYRFARSWDSDLSYIFTSVSSNVRQSSYDRSVVSLTVTYHF